MAAIVFEPHVLLRWGGTLGDDTWSCGLRIRLPGSVPGARTAWAQAHLNDLVDVVRDWYMEPLSYHNALSTLGWVKCNAIAANGRYEDPGVTNLVELQPPVTLAWQRVAPQLAWAVTLRTAKKRGRAHAGRIYVPTAQSLVQANGTVDTARCAELAATAATFVAAVGDVDTFLDGTWVGVFSPIDATVERVRSIDVGNVLDTQQRRRRQIRETYSNATNTSLSAPG